MFARFLALALLFIGAPVGAQDWSDASGIVVRDLAAGGTPLDASFFPDSPDPAQASRGLGIVYVAIEGAAGNASLEAGLFQREGGVWRLHRRVTGLFGLSPRDPLFDAAGFYVTTSMLGPNDARCCPSEATVWFVDWATGQASKR